MKIRVLQGRSKVDFILESDEPFFSNKGYLRASQSRWSKDHVRHLMRLRAYAFDKFRDKVPDDMLEWLRDQGAIYTVNIVGPDPENEFPVWRAVENQLRLTFGDTQTALLFRLSW